MKNRFIKSVALLTASCIMIAGLCSCGMPGAGTPAPSMTPAPAVTPEAASTPAPTATPRPVVTIHGMLPGDAPADMGDVLSAMNVKLMEDTSTQLDLSWIPVDQYDAGIAAAGQNIDFFECDSSQLADYASKQLIMPLDEMMSQYGQDIAKNIDAGVIDTMKIGGKLMGIPGAGQTPLAGASLALIYRGAAAQILPAQARLAGQHGEVLCRHKEKRAGAHSLELRGRCARAHACSGP